MKVCYAQIETPRLIDAARISSLFGKPANWFQRDRVRKSLYAHGFPAPVIRGRWLRTAVEAWLERRGNQAMVPPTRRRHEQRTTPRALP